MQIPEGFNMALLPEPAAEGVLRATCPVCGEHRQIYRGSRLPCHAACLLTQDFQDRLADDVTPMRVQAERLGITEDVVRANIHAALRRKERRRRSA